MIYVTFERVYYYFKTKRELFTALYTWMFDKMYEFSQILLENAQGMGPVQQLMYYCYGMFCAGGSHPRMMQFSMRIPFDAAAVFGPGAWREGAQKSNMHRKALADIIAKGMEEGVVPKADPGAAANSFWSVFVANAFEYSKMIDGSQEAVTDNLCAFENVVRFGFQGLGISRQLWQAGLEKVVREYGKEGPVYEGL